MIAEGLDPGLLHVGHLDGQAHGENARAEPGVEAHEGASDAPPLAENDEALSKYRKMLSMHVPKREFCQRTLARLQPARFPPTASHVLRMETCSTA